MFARIRDFPRSEAGDVALALLVCIALGVALLLFGVSFGK
jgi:hypothetical protein